MGELYSKGVYEVKATGVFHHQLSKGVSSIRYQITGSGATAAVKIQGTVDGTNYLDIPDSTISAFGDGISEAISVISYEKLRLVCTDLGTGPFQITVLYGDLSSAATIIEPLTVELDDDTVGSLTEEIPPTERFAYNANGDVEYSGTAAPGVLDSQALWRIRRYTYSGFSVTRVEFADGDSEFDNVWDDYLTLSYS